MPLEDKMCKMQKIIEIHSQCNGDCTPCEINICKKECGECILFKTKHCAEGDGCAYNIINLLIKNVLSKIQPNLLK